jgi:hypothetical protein
MLSELTFTKNVNVSVKYRKSIAILLYTNINQSYANVNVLIQTMRLNAKNWAKVNFGIQASVAANVPKQNFVLQDFSSVMILAGEAYF